MGGLGVDLELALGTNRQHTHLVVLAQVEFAQGLTHKSPRHLDLLNAVAIIKAQLLEQVGPHQLHAQPLALHLRGEHHPIGPHPLQHLEVQVTGGPGNHLTDLRVLGVLTDQGGGHARLNGVADGHHHRGELQDTRRAKGLLIGAIHHTGLNRRLTLTQFIDGPLAGINRQHIGTGAQQLGAHRGTKSPHPDHSKAAEIPTITLAPLPPLVHRLHFRSHGSSGVESSEIEMKRMRSR